jgi:peroxiredoxin
MDVKHLVCSVWLATGVASPSCAARPPRSIPEIALPGTDGAVHALVDPGARLTVIVFFSARCPCQAQHDARLRELASAYSERGVAFVAVDSEVDAGLARDHDEAARRGYAFPILVDAGGSVARALHAEYATYTLIVDREARVVYVGGIDSDKRHLTSGATPYLRDALDDALAAKPLRRAEGKTLGCALLLE